MVGSLVGLTDHPVGIQQSVAQLIQCGPAVKNEVVAKLHLGEEEPVLAAATFAFAFFEERSQTGQPFLPAAEQVVGAQAICELLELLWMTASEECIGTLLKIDAFGTHAFSQPVVLLEANTCSKRQI